MKTALVTGGTHGIGLEIAKQLKDDGHFIYTCARGNYEPTENFIVCDLSKQKDINNLMNIIKSVDILICNSGGGGRWGNENWLKNDYSLWQKVYDKNSGYIIQLINKYLPKMIKKEWGRVITISSILGKESSDDGRPWFQISKSAQISLMKSYSKNKEYVRNGITFNTISPGAIMIPDTGWDKMKRENIKEYNKFLDTLPMGKIGEPTDVSNIVSFLCSEKANYINGANIVVDGGQSYGF